MERYWRTLFNNIKIRFSDSNIASYLWPYNANYCNFIWNQVKIVEKREIVDGFEVKAYYTPYQLFTGNRSSMKDIKRWGCVASVHVPKSLRRPLDYKGELGYFVSIDDISRSYYIYIPSRHKVIRSGDYILDELHMNINEPSLNLVEIDNETESNKLRDQEVDQILYNAGVLEKEPIITEINNNNSTLPANTNENTMDMNPNDYFTLAVPPNERPKRSNIRPVYDPNEYATTTLELSFDMNKYPKLPEEEPEDRDGLDFYVHVDMAMKGIATAKASAAVEMTPQEALGKPKWEQSMERELASIDRNITWRVEIMPSNCRSFKNRWVFSDKTQANGCIIEKSRLTIKGYEARKGIDYDNTYSPVVKLITLRTFFATCALFGLNIAQLDAETAFLNASFGANDPPVYVEVPIGYEKKFAKMCHEANIDPKNPRVRLRLLKALYGLKQSPRAWNKEIDRFLKTLGFVALVSDVCVYIKTDGTNIIILPLYVDDFIVGFNNIDYFNAFKEQLMSQYKMKDLGMISYVLGIHVRCTEFTIELDQERYVMNLLEKYGLHKCNPRQTPFDEHDINDLAVLSVQPNVVYDENINQQYRSLVGALMYPMICTRPDIAYHVSILSRYLGKATNKHLEIGKKILRYLRGTSARKIIYKRQTMNTSLIGYVDADLGGCIVTGKSTFAYLIYLAGSLIAWKTKLQKKTAQSSTEAEYVGLSNIIKEIIWLSYVLIGFKIPKLLNDQPILVYEDNQGAIDIANNPINGERTKHMNLNYHFIRDEILDGRVKVVHMGTKNQLADISTKYKGQITFKEMTDRMFNLDDNRNIEAMQEANWLHNQSNIVPITNYMDMDN